MNELGLEESLSSLNRQVGDINYAINGVGPQDTTSVMIRLAQIVNLLGDLRTGLSPANGANLASWLTFSVVLGHVWHHW